MENDEQIDQLERHLHDAIRFHREQYETAIKPLLDKLGMIQGLRPRVLILSKDQIDSLNIQPFVPPPFPESSR